MHNIKVELQGKCRRLFFAKLDGPEKIDEDGNPISGELQHLAGDVLGVASGGGALAELTGDDLIIATFNDQTAPARIGCIEEFFSPLPILDPIKVDLRLVQSCIDAVDVHRKAVKDERDFVFETGIKIFNTEYPTTERLHHQIKVQEASTRYQNEATIHDQIIVAQTDLDIKTAACLGACEQLLITRDAAITFASVS